MLQLAMVSLKLSDFSVAPDKNKKNAGGELHRVLPQNFNRGILHLCKSPTCRRQDFQEEQNIRLFPGDTVDRSFFQFTNY